MSADLVVWDFDGVLNAEPPEGPFAWVDRLDEALGLSPQAFRDFLNQPRQAARVLRGEAVLEVELAAWLATQETEVTAETLLTQWLTCEDRPDAQVIAWLEQSPQRAVIGTNNPAPRADYIMQIMGFASRVETIFASGPMGVAKPDPGFYGQIERWSQLVPRQILLIDDNRANVAAAAQRGWQTFLFDDRSRADLPERLGLA
ncbi:HAD family hydrolase [Maliponia aquimaris]|uniref:Phosphoglycolate phosphatase n=1 Tax=Maliponia aquimaris TaxID=1673631 RepID=A0A238K212_9RHOB|nr:HAD-IA family hydrolase [Maliponia aquimaris]SMX36915.1 Phosphoglycolate phosphatase [Maliponia aquimaris]